MEIKVVVRALLDIDINFGNAIAANIPKITITVTNSIKVKPVWVLCVHPAIRSVGIMRFSLFFALHEMCFIQQHFHMLQFARNSIGDL